MGLCRYDLLHNLGPLFFALGLIVLLGQIARRRPRGLMTISPVLVVLDFLMLGANLKLLSVAAVILALAIIPATGPESARIVRRPGRTRRADYAGARQRTA